ncbi:MarR family winged helix-turn-helix transcriptional regulator [Streptomyces montanisoli]|uniref:MarR family transcriptional regulator n=1 Tax=Streptomyces montanisoli TaxID=2798581 RepID=A0A940MBQ1_9ACTN|nr:MarR family transcriptional regulator [Streptomyces montanisoli]MBP0457963.1 MarR family transcriptional regulator [Streptomyces montanisoli]
MADDGLADELRQSIGALVRTVRAVDTMPPGEAAALGYLDRGGPLTTADLAQRRGVTHQSAAKSVKELAAGGLVRAEPHPSDGRKLLLHITDDGRARLKGERAQRARVLDAAIRDEFSAEERRRLADCVGLLSRLTGRLAGR